MRVLLLGAALAATPLCVSAPVETPPPAAPAAPTDETIRLAVENEVLRSGVIEGHAIDVISDKGVVTLSGRVHNLFARQIASRLAQRVRGVQSVINEIEIVGVARDDGAIQKDIEAALQADPATSGLKVGVKVEGARATLTGEVPAHGLKTLASRVASKVKGLLEIDNQLVPDAKSRPDDVELKAALTQLIQSSALLDDANLKVSVKAGTAVVDGIVRTSLQKSFVSDLARDAGAADVDVRGIKVEWNADHAELRTRRYETATDAQVQAVLDRVFKMDPRLLSYPITAKVVKGAVTLTGAVGSVVAKDSAVLDARQTIGVRSVDDHLRVRWDDKPPTDEKIADFTRAALKRDAYVERHDIVVDCNNGHVGLYGVVDTEFEKEHAEWTAGSQNGVVHVNDYLAVRKQWVPKSDAAIEKDLKNKLAYDFVDPNNQVTATVEDGVAILRGTVDTWLMWQTAMELALEAGCRRPHNLIEVRYSDASTPRFSGPHTYVPE